MKFSFTSFCNYTFDWDPEKKLHTSLTLKEENPDIGGGRIRMSDIDRLRDYPNEDTVTISGLRQDTFEYFINTYGNQFKAIRFFKNKFIEDWSLLGTLPNIQYLYFFFNQRIDQFWDMSTNHALTGLAVMDFSRIKNIELVNTAPRLEDFRIGNEIWSTMVIDSFMPLAGTPIRHLSCTAKNIMDQDLSFLDSMPYLETFNFTTNLFTTEQVAWIAANHPEVSGCSITPYTGYPTDEKPDSDGWVVGKRKPFLKYIGNEEKISKYEKTFNELKIKYKGISYHDAFPNRKNA